MTAVLPSDLRNILKKTSRSFYLSIAILPRSVRVPVAFAYLLARTADTIADTELFPLAHRASNLRKLQLKINPAANDVIIESIELPSGLAVENHALSEYKLLRALPAISFNLTQLGSDDQKLVRQVVSTLIDGMLFDLEFFAGSQASRPGVLESTEQLERYLYSVAGCVGEFWTQLLRHHICGLHDWPKLMDQVGMEFGKALQLTNILRDLYKDREIGRIYLPLNAPEPAHWMHAALGYYKSAEIYITSIPRRYVRLRLAAFWPAIIGLATLALLASHANWQSDSRVHKVKRGTIYKILALSIVTISSNTITRAWLRRSMRRCELN